MGKINTTEINNFKSFKKYAVNYLSSFYASIVANSQTWKDFNKYCILYSESQNDPKVLETFYEILFQGEKVKPLPHYIIKIAQDVKKGNYKRAQSLINELAKYYYFIDLPYVAFLPENRPKGMQAYCDLDKKMIFIYMYIAENKIIPPFSFIENLLHEFTHFLMPGFLHTRDFYISIGKLRKGLKI